MKTYREKVFIIEWSSLPKEQKDFVYENLTDRFENGVFIEWPTEFTPYNEESFQDTLTMKEIENYWNGQSKINNYKGTLDEFIEDYGLKFEVWIIEQKFDLTGIKKILIKIEW